MVLALLPFLSARADAVGPPVFINEIHYDNDGADAGEFVEVAGPAGTDLAGWSIALYNGSASQLSVYDTINLSGVISDQSNGYGTLSFARAGIQNGSPDGLALVDAGSAVIQFLSYEGSFTAGSGPANGMTSTDIGVAEASSTPAGESLQLIGAGSMGGDFTWTGPTAESPGAVNVGQTFEEGTGTPQLVINEIDYDQASTDTGEFVELKNVGTAAADLSQYTIELVNGSTGSAYNTIALPAATLAAGDYYVVCANAATVDNCDLDSSPDTNFIQNGAPDAVGLLLDGALVDAVSYEGDTTGYTEGSGSGLADDPGVDGAGISRYPDGTDTDQNNVDLSLRCSTPGEANVVESSDCIPVTTITKIHDVQGDGLASPLVGDTVTIEGIVVGDFQDGAAGTNGDLNGFMVQEEDTDADADPLTSEGIFIFNGSSPSVDVQIGDLVQVEGPVSEFNGLTEMSSFSGVSVVSSGNPLPTAATASLPVTAVDDFEAFEGMLVTFPQALVISEYFNFDRFNEIVLTSQRNLTPTAEVEPGPDAVDEAANYLLDRITLDDGRTNQNPDPAIHPNGAEFNLDNLFRGGDTVANVTGVMDYGFGLYRIQPTQGADYTNANPRPLTPDDVGGSLEVATFNVLNYFTTIDEPGAMCYPTMTRSDCRGADDAEEFTRQRDKIISALAEIDADVVGLLEIENNGDAAVADLVSGLNDSVGTGTYAYVASGTTGTDAIRVALIYKPATVSLSGAHAVLAGTFLDPAGTGEDRNRAAIAQTFTENATGESFTAVVNHFKSKSGSEIDDSGAICVDADPGNDIPDCDQGDGQAYFNYTRTLAAEMLAQWLATDPTGSGDPDVIIIGDLNSYDKEDPIDVLKGAGYRDLLLTYQGEAAYSYVFDGQTGYLDYQMSSPSLSPKVTGATVWHINADEPDLIDYDTSFKGPNQDAIYAPDAYRSSDHDPVIVGLDLENPMGMKEKAIGDLQALLPTGSRFADGFIDKAIKDLEKSLHPEYWADDSHLTDKGRKVFAYEAIAVLHMGIASFFAPEVHDIKAALVEADAELAQTAIDIAVATGGNEKSIARAMKWKERGDQAAAHGWTATAIARYGKAWHHAVAAVEDARFATFNASLNRFNAGDLVTELSAPGSSQPATIAEIVQRTRPEVLLVNEFDYDAAGTSAFLFQRNYLSVSQNGADPIEYPFHYTAPSNTGIPSGFDLNNDGSVGGPDDAFGFGFFPGQYGMVVYSMHPIDEDDIRTFQKFLWKDMPGALLPENPPGTPWYSDDELDVFRLSSKSHWDVPVLVGDRTVHFLVSHPTPPVFDGPEDRNGTRNFDEIRFWADYIDPSASGYIYDDNGNSGGLAGNSRFVIAGDQNSDPNDGDSIPGAAQQLLNSPKVNTSITPSSPGGPEQSVLQGGINTTHISDPAYDTADFADSAPGNLRADYVLPSKKMKMVDAGVFWPLSTDPLFSLVGTFPFPSSDHRLVWIDIIT